MEKTEKDAVAKDYWESQAKTHKGSHLASWSDNFMIELEIDAVGEHISSGDHILDVGCANGYSAFQQLERHRDVGSITGVDFAENMIKQANTLKKAQWSGDVIKFEVGDINALQFDDASFDLVYATRVVTLMDTWEEQQVAINECLRVVKPGGKVILSEPFLEPFTLLNALRQLKDMPPLVEHDSNRFFKKELLENFLMNKGLSFTVNEFSSIYYLGSRFLRELVTDPAAYPGFNPINRIFYDIEKDFSGGGFGIQQAYIITK
ncbi:MAG: class I SAM-dependent methyltransferase [Candidatus Nitrotoga sp.]|nr:class I SAM-dependent methyltransferase [Candidatus Nitrotoga sp.]MBP0118836.1 class I SAM-dependent methyltransferase [Candidatus Nitrotoga sp.]